MLAGVAVFAGKASAPEGSIHFFRYSVPKYALWTIINDDANRLAHPGPLHQPLLPPQRLGQQTRLGFGQKGLWRVAGTW